MRAGVGLWCVCVCGGREGWGGWRRRGEGRGGVEANDRLQRQFTPSCKVSKVSFEIRCCICSQPRTRLQHVLFCATNDCCPLVSRTLPVSLSRACSSWWASFSAQRCCRECVSFSPNLGRMKFVIFFCSFYFRHLLNGFTFVDNWRLSS